MRHRGISGNRVTSPRAKKNPAIAGGVWCKALAMTYSCMRMHTTIGAAAFHFRVRNGIGWCHSAIVTRERVEGRGSIGLVDGLIALTLPRGGCSEQFASLGDAMRTNAC